MADKFDKLQALKYLNDHQQTFYMTQEAALWNAACEILDAPEAQTFNEEELNLMIKIAKNNIPRGSSNCID